METYTKLASTDADAQKVTVQNNSIPKSEYSASKIKNELGHKTGFQTRCFPTILPYAVKVSSACLAS